MKPNYIELEDAWEVLEPFSTFFVDILLDYMDVINSAELVPIRAPMNRRSFCSTLGDYFYACMEQAPEHGSQFERLVDRGQDYISFGDKVIIRVKQLDKRHLSWNLETPHSTQWNEQLPVNGMAPAPRLELGYRLNELMSDCDSAHVLLRIGKQIDWRIQIYGQRTDTYDFEQPQLPDMGPSRKRYVYRPVTLRRDSP